jgi:hypothetical protein
MTFFDVPVRRLCFVRAGGLFVLAAAFLLFPLLCEVDSLGRNFLLVFVGLCLLFGLLNIFWGLRTSPAEIRPPIHKAPVSVQAQYYRRMFRLSALVFPIMTCWLAYDLHSLELGSAKSVRIWEPFALIYRNFGYWPAVLSSLLLGVICCLFFLSKMKKLSSEERGGTA